VPRRLDPRGLRAFLAQGSLPAERTLVEGVCALPPGGIGIWQEGRWHTQLHWQPSYAPEAPLPYPDLVAYTRQALEASVQAHLLADVPVGLFLSGGLDSAAVLALVSRPLTTITIGFAERAFDESEQAAALARHFGAEHHVLPLGAAEAWRFLPGFLAAIDQPSVDGFNSYCVASRAAELGLKVVLSGLGGDELFGGYPSFARVPSAWALHRRLDPLAPAGAAWLSRSHRAGAQRLAAALRRPASIDNTYRCLRGLFAPAEVERLLGHWALASAPEHGRVGHEPIIDPEDQQRYPDPSDRVAWLESSLYMGNQLLRDGDAMTMAFGLELRLPLVDAALFRALASQPAAQRLATGKRLLRDAVPELRSVLPDRPKQGFLFPFQPWFDTPGSETGEQFLLPNPSTPAGLDMGPWARRWGLMVLNDWLQRHLGLILPTAPPMSARS